jgi:predicted CXXCH cytochrome family protein
MEVERVRKLALLIVGGALWLFVGALTVLADGGPHNLANNSGTAGLAGDCASCHRAHTAQAPDLLREELPGLCINCHNGTKATTDVQNGVQYVPTGTAGVYQDTAVLGALRGGGFSYALIDSSNAARLMYGGTQVITIDGAPTGGTFTLTFDGQTTAPLGFNSTAAQVQTALVNLANIGTSNTYVGSTDGAYMSSETINNVTVSGAWPTYTLNFQNEMRVAAQPLITGDASGLTGGTTITVADTTAVRSTAAVGVLTTGAAVTSTHDGTGTVWGNGEVGSGVGPEVDLDCAKCHNPHGNGMYRILQTKPGEDWAGLGTGFEETLQAVEVQDVPNPDQTHNYTVLPGVQAQDVITAGYTADQGDYFHRKYDPSGAANWTNYYLIGDPMVSGWNGTSATNKAANGGVAPANSSGLMTAWCITCHTRYAGLPDATTGSPSSLVDTSGGDSYYMYKHGTTRIGCEQCHVSHGSNALMTAAASSTAEWPDGTPSNDSRLLKVDNRGTCNLCHDPTGTTTPGTATGPVPGSITPGP